MPTEIIEFSERQQNYCSAAKKRDEADGAPQQSGPTGMVSGKRIIREIVGVGVRCTRSLCHRAPCGPGEKRGQVVQFLRIADHADGKTPIVTVSYTHLRAH